MMSNNDLSSIERLILLLNQKSLRETEQRYNEAMDNLRELRETMGLNSLIVDSNDVPIEDSQNNFIKAL
jgi:hypothetical protein